MAKVTVVYKMRTTGLEYPIAGAFSDNQTAWDYIDAKNDDNLIADEFEIDALVDDEFKPELPSNHPCRDN